ncbi:hypothetical protein Mgra_00002913 [Meloidogyne graminicola]|uniref:C3H1-type domain-containing protein n=1 Tax=Meloidogyne graminicola TaxID=189291 RepID=A0A8S9ZVP3_9BILA|nr:hypothetical protein Mgra_00002913 [Meloidogyne graminicola]
MSDTESNNETIKTQNNIRIKASICNTWLRKGYCPRGLACIYAHGTDELNDSEVDEKKQTTVICKYFFTTGWCRSGDSCRFMHPFNGNSSDDKVKNNRDVVLDSSSNENEGNSSINKGKRLQKNYTSLCNLSVPPPSFKSNNEGNNKKKENNNNNTKNNNNNLLDNNCFLNASRLKNKETPTPLTFVSGGFGTSRRHGIAGLSSSITERGGSKKDVNQNGHFDELDEEDDPELTSQLDLLGKKFSKMEKQPFGFYNKH